MGVSPGVTGTSCGKKQLISYKTVARKYPADVYHTCYVQPAATSPGANCMTRGKCDPTRRRDVRIAAYGEGRAF